MSRENRLLGRPVRTAGAAALAFLALRAGNLSAFSFAPTYTVTANFDNVGGLKVRAPVKSAGVVVGRIAGISFDDKTFQAVVSINLETTYKFPRTRRPPS